MKIKRIRLYWFSGTGNTLDAARTFADSISKRGIATELFRLPCEFPAEWPEDEAIAIFFPVYAFMCPPFLWQHLSEKLPPGKGAPAIGLATMGGSGAMPALEGVRRLLLKKGYVPFAANGLIMPSNCFSTGSPEKNAELMRTARLHAEDFAESIVLESCSWRKCLAPPRFLHSLQMFLLGRAWRWGGKKFRASKEKCSRCGLCAKLCPTHNIEMTESGPRWDGKCGHCLRCMNYCPQGAITAPGKHFVYPDYRAERSSAKSFINDENI